VRELKNPANDGRVIADAFLRLAFSEVMERYDLGLAGTTAALKEFGDFAANADWAGIYLAGDGLEMGGTAYLVPVDARLERDAHVLDETVPLERMLQKTETAKKFGLVILDACRNHPFVTRMARTGGSTRHLRILPRLTQARPRQLPASAAEPRQLAGCGIRHWPLWCIRQEWGELSWGG
jgi:uncharacterized caspase-like protein